MNLWSDHPLREVQGRPLAHMHFVFLQNFVKSSSVSKKSQIAKIQNKHHSRGREDLKEREEIQSTSMEIPKINPNLEFQDLDASCLSITSSNTNQILQNFVRVCQFPKPVS